jgi:hypothetical protein
MRRLVGIVVGAALTAATARAGEPGGTPDALFFAEAAVAGTLGVGLFAVGGAVGGDAKANEGTTREKAALAVYGVTPFVTGLSVYVIGETAGLRARNRGACLAAATAASFGATAAAAAAGYALTREDKKAGAISAAFYALIPVGFLTAVVYNAVKEPYFAELPGFSLRVEPYTGFARLDSAGVAPVAGVSFSF